MRNILISRSILCIAALASLGCKTSKPSPGGSVVIVKSKGFSFEYPTKYFKSWAVRGLPRLTVQENGTDIPLGIAPARSRWEIEMRGSSLWPPTAMGDLGKAHIEIIPLSDPSVPSFPLAYPGLVQDARDLLEMSQGRVPKVKPRDYLPDWDCVDMHQTVHAKARSFSTQSFRGIEFITQYTQEESGIDNQGLTYVYQGVSNDGAYYLAVRIPVGHSVLPLHAKYYDQNKDEPYESYLARVDHEYSQIEQMLDSKADDSFLPQLSVLRNFVGSIRVAK